MNNPLVDLVLESFGDIAFANGLKIQDLHPIADLVVMRLQEAGYADDDISLAFSSTDVGGGK